MIKILLKHRVHAGYTGKPVVDYQKLVELPAVPLLDHTVNCNPRTEGGPLVVRHAVFTPGSDVVLVELEPDNTAFKQPNRYDEIVEAHHNAGWIATTAQCRKRSSKKKPNDQDT